jgi:integrase
VNNKSIILPPKSECGVRDILIQERLKPYLTNRGAEQEYLFGRGTKPPTKHMFEKMWKRIESHLKGIGLSSHILRHTFITECAENDVPVNVTQEMAGHSTPGITLGTYTHVTEKMKQNAMRKLNSL